MSGYAVSGNISGRICEDFGVAHPGVACPVGLIHPAPGVCVPGVVHPGVDAPAGVCAPAGVVANELVGGSSENPTLLPVPGPPGRSGKYEDRAEMLAAFGVDSGV